MSSITIHVPTRVSAPRGALLAAQAFSRLLSWFENSRALRARALDENSRVGDAARVRRFAQQIMADDPRFAADLFAAADRHERC